MSAEIRSISAFAEMAIFSFVLRKLIDIKLIFEAVASKIFINSAFALCTLHYKNSGELYQFSAVLFSAMLFIISRISAKRSA